MDQIINLLGTILVVLALGVCGWFLRTAFCRPEEDGGGNPFLMIGALVGFSAIAMFGLQTLLFFIPEGWGRSVDGEWQQTRRVVACALAFLFTISIIGIPNSAFLKGKHKGAFDLLAEIGQMTENEIKCLTQIMKQCEEAVRANDEGTLNKIRWNYDQVVNEIRAELEGAQNPRKSGDYALVYRYKSVIIQQINQRLR